MTREELLQVAKPILFNTDMVRAILDDRKTATRRIMKPQPILQNGLWLIGFAGWGDGVSSIPIIPGHSLYKRMPYKPGDYLYVRETWSEWTDGYVYKAWTEPFPQPGKSAVMKWHPSIHMPKAAARIFLRVKDVRVERLQDIGNFVKEGVSQGTHATAHMNYYDEKCDFVVLWNSTIHKKDLDKYGWDANPWVWVIEFERIYPD